MEELLKQTKAYLNYIEEHYNNVQEAWKIVQNKCSDMEFIWDDFEFNYLNKEIECHDFSKLTTNEFTAYRAKFFPLSVMESGGVSVNNCMINIEFESAWDNHKNKNDHHWQTWTTIKYGYPRMQHIHCVHMLVDWIAMSMKFGDTAIEYYNKNKHQMNTLPDWTDEFIMDILNKVYSKENK